MNRYREILKPIIDSHEEDLNHWDLENTIGMQEAWEVEKIAQIKSLLRIVAELQAHIELERRMHERTTEHWHGANTLLSEISALPVIDGCYLVKTFNGDYVSPDDFVSATQLQAIINRKKAE